MSVVEFLKDSHEVWSSHSDSSEVGDLNIGCDFQGLQPYRPSRQSPWKIPLNEFIFEYNCRLQLCKIISQETFRGASLSACLWY